MPEDQNVNGDKWTDEAGSLLEHFGWEIVGDKNIDILDTSEKPVGIDSLCRFQDGFKPNIYQGVFFEAKRYKESTFRKSKKDLEKWIKTLDNKITRLKRSPDLQERYPNLAKNCDLTTGLIAIWFYDVQNINTFNNFFYKTLGEVEISSRSSKFQSNKIFVITNDKILELISLQANLKDLVYEEKLDSTKDIKFFYPSSLQLGSGVNETNVLNIHYMFSKFIFAKIKRKDNTILHLVFYFGEIDFKSFNRLIEAMLGYNFWVTSNDLRIYRYQDNDEFRKVEPEIMKEFDKRNIKSSSKIEIIKMNKLSDLPNWIQ